MLSTGGDMSALTNAQMGDLLVILALVFFTYTYFPGAKVSREIGTVGVNAVTNVLGGIMLIPFVFLFAPNASFALSGNGIFLFSGYLLAFYMTGLPLWYVALKTVKSWIVSSLLAISSIVGGILAFLWLGDVLTPIQLIGAAIILASSTLIAMQNKK